MHKCLRNQHACACFPLPLPLLPRNNKAHSKSPNSNSPLLPTFLPLASILSASFHLSFSSISSQIIIYDSIATADASSSAFDFSHLSKLPGLYGLANVIL
jgi:hypothetical protein